MTFTVERGVPIPEVKGNRGRKEKYPWSALKVGDSFFVQGGNADAMRAVAGPAGRRHGGAKYAIRTIEGGVRVWRVA